MDNRITIRPATPGDDPLLLSLFAEEKAAELLPLGLEAEQLRPLLEMQCRGRPFSYSEAATAADHILCTADGTAVGRILVDRKPECLHVMDVAVLTAYRNRGFATQALQQIKDEAGKASLPVRLRVMQNNPAERLYQRLGFTQVSRDEISLNMEWRPAPAATLDNAAWESQAHA